MRVDETFSQRVVSEANAILQDLDLEGCKFGVLGSISSPCGYWNDSRGRRDKRGAEVNGWTIWAKAFQAEGRASTKAWSYRRLAICPPMLPATFSFALSLCWLRAI